MSFADYTALKAAIANDWLHRSDMATTIGDAITLFESDFNSSMRVRQMEAQTSVPSTIAFLPHPTNWLGWKEIRLTSGARTYDLTPVTDEIGVIRSLGTNSTSTPRSYKVKGARTYTYPPVTAGVTFTTTYWEGVGLTSGTNWLLTQYPGAYLYGALLQCVAAGIDDPRVPLWENALRGQDGLGGILGRIRADSKRQEWSGQALQMKPDMQYMP
jgi:hypothetical protein